MLNIEDQNKIKGTILERYIDLAKGEKPPEVYKPREGKALSN